MEPFSSCQDTHARFSRSSSPLLTSFSTFCAATVSAAADDAQVHTDTVSEEGMGPQGQAHTEPCRCLMTIFYTHDLMTPLVISHNDTSLDSCTGNLIACICSIGYTKRQINHNRWILIHKRQHREQCTHMGIEVSMATSACCWSTSGSCGGCFVQVKGIA